MKQKKTRIKIKKSKHNLYNKKKSKSRQTLTIVLTIVAACVLGVVGYGIGKPIMNYFQSRGEHSADPSDQDNSSDVSSDISGGDQSGDISGDSSGDSSGSDTPPVPPEVEDIKLYVLPVDATASSASLGSALAAAKEAGYDTVAVTLKDENGYLYYKTEVERVRYDSIIVKGTLTAAQIAEQITNAGMTPAAKISMLKDRITPMYFGGFTFENGTHWLDDYPPPDGSGKRWLSPFVPESVQYLTNIASELAGAGFEHIICENITYPAFHPIDIDTYLKHLSLTDRTKRLNALWDMADAAKGAVEAHGAKFWIELNGADFIKADRFGTNAEIAGSAEKLSGVGVIVDYSQSGTESVYDNAKAFAGSLRTAAGENNDIAVLVKRGTSGAVSEDIRRAFEENGLRLFTGN